MSREVIEATFGRLKKEKAMERQMALMKSKACKVREEGGDSISNAPSACPDDSLSKTKVGIMKS